MWAFHFCTYYMKSHAYIRLRSLHLGVPFEFTDADIIFSWWNIGSWQNWCQPEFCLPRIWPDSGTVSKGQTIHVELECALLDQKTEGDPWDPLKSDQKKAHQLWNGFRMFLFQVPRLESTARSSAKSSTGKESACGCLPLSRNSQPFPTVRI